MTGCVTPLMKRAAKPGYNGIMTTLPEMHKFCDKYHLIRKGLVGSKKNTYGYVPVVREHNNEESIGQIMFFYVDKDNKLCSMFRIDAASPYSDEIVQKIERGEKLGLSLSMSHFENPETMDIKKKIIRHLGIVEDPDFGDYGTWVHAHSSDPVPLLKKLTSESSYVSENDIGIIQKKLKSTQTNQGSYDKSHEFSNEKNTDNLNPTQNFSESFKNNANNNNEFLNQQYNSFKNLSEIKTSASASRTYKMNPNGGQTDNANPSGQSQDSATGQQQQQNVSDTSSENGKQDNINVDTKKQLKRPRDEKNEDADNIREEDYLKILEQKQKLLVERLKELERYKEIEEKFGSANEIEKIITEANVTKANFEKSQEELRKEKEALENKKREEIEDKVQKFNQNYGDFMSSSEKQKYADLFGNLIPSGQYDVAESFLEIGTKAFGGRHDSQTTVDAKREQEKQRRFTSRQQKLTEDIDTWTRRAGGYGPRSSEPRNGRTSPQYQSKQQSQQQQVPVKTNINEKTTETSKVYQNDHKRKYYEMFNLPVNEPPVKENNGTTASQNEMDVEQDEEDNPLVEIQTLASKDPYADVTALIFKGARSSDFIYRDDVHKTLHMRRIIENISQNPQVADYQSPHSNRYDGVNIQESHERDNWAIIKDADTGNRYCGMPIPAQFRWN
jgi:hypothetical protein